MNAGATALENLRTANGWTRRELAAHVGLDEPLISRLLRGIRRPNLEQATKIELKTGVRPALWMQGHVAEPEPEEPAA